MATTPLDLKQKRIEQLKQWKKDNVLGFALYKTTVGIPGEYMDIVLRLEQWQCKDGIYIIQINDDDQSFLIFKTNSDICIKS